ncbi:MAG: ROK family glucokinase [Nocardioidaceae bacterium]
MTLTIGVDVGGTKIAAGVVKPDGTIVETLRRVTPAHEARATEDVIIAVVAELRQGHEVEAVGIGAAGYIDVARATVLFAPNLAWRDEPLKATVEDAVGIPVVVENDANAAAWGEFRFGAGADVDDLLMVAIGTGIGGGIVLDGELFRGTFGIAGEFGHVKLVPDGRMCGCGNRGCWEQYASGSALVREVRKAAGTGSPAAVAIVAAAGGDPKAITGQMVTAAAKDGDPLCVEAFQTIGEWLGRGLADLASIFDPGVVVIGGGVSEAGDLLLDPARASYRRQLSGRGHRPEMEIRLAALGNSAGMSGAADLARRR